MVIANKTDTMREFIEKIKAEASDSFCGEDYFKNIENKNLRLRQYDTKLKIKQKIYQDEEIEQDGKTTNSFDSKRLMDFNFHSYFEFKIEVLADGDVKPEGCVDMWEEFDPDWMYYRVWTWPKYLEARLKHLQGEAGAAADVQDDDEDDIAVNIVDLESFPCELLRANFRTDRVSDLQGLIASHTGIAAEDLAILIRHEPIL